MCTRTHFGIVALLLPLAVGCMHANHGVVRGQSPSGHPSVRPAASVEPSGVERAGGLYNQAGGGIQQLGASYDAGPAYGPGYGPACGPGGCGPGGYGAGGCGQCPSCGDCSGRCGHRGDGPDSSRVRDHLREMRNGPGGAWYPTHHHHFSYEAPRNLQYPAANVPPAVVAYPYYTVKGPDDFFKAD